MRPTKPANFFPEEPFLPAFLKRGKNESWISARGNAAEDRGKSGQWDGGRDKKDVLFFSLETRLNCEISRAIPRT